MKYKKDQPVKIEIGEGVIIGYDLPDSNVSRYLVSITKFYNKDNKGLYKDDIISVWPKNITTIK